MLGSNVAAKHSDGDRGAASPSLSNLSRRLGRNAREGEGRSTEPAPLAEACSARTTSSVVHRLHPLQGSACRDFSFYFKGLYEACTPLRRGRCSTLPASLIGECPVGTPFSVHGALRSLHPSQGSALPGHQTLSNGVAFYI